MVRLLRRTFNVGTVGIVALFIGSTSSVRAEEIWVAPTYQQDVGGLGVGSNTYWPVTPFGVVRLAWPVPADLSSFTSARVVIIAPVAYSSSLNVIVCRAKHATPVFGLCNSPVSFPFSTSPNRLIEVDVSGAIAPDVVEPGLTYLTVVAYTTTAGSDRMLGLRFSYEPTPPTGTVGGGGLYANVAIGPGALSNHPTGTGNTAAGSLALASNTTGSGNSAVGNFALLNNTTGGGNTSVGVSSLANAHHGNSNTALGDHALNQIWAGDQNTAIGASALRSHGDEVIYRNTAVGFEALNNVRSGANENTALGHGALSSVEFGTGNIAVGQSAGANLATGSNNIYLGNSGGTSESNTLRIAGAGVQDRAFIAGIRGVTTGNSDAIPVYIDSNGQLGTISSSARFKEDIADMGAASRRLLQLRPVTFKYKQTYSDGSKPIQFGLIAEEVARVFPELAVRNATGELETVRYDLLNVLLLNELQQQDERIERLLNELQQQDSRLDGLENQLHELRQELP